MGRSFRRGLLALGVMTSAGLLVSACYGCNDMACGDDGIFAAGIFALPDGIFTVDVCYNNSCESQQVDVTLSRGSATFASLDGVYKTAEVRFSKYGSLVSVNLMLPVKRAKARDRCRFKVTNSASGKVEVSWDERVYYENEGKGTCGGPCWVVSKDLTPGAW